MRRTTLLWMVLAAICGATLFHTSQQVTDGRTRLAQLEEDTRKESETLRVLQAEWSYLNQPDRLEKLSRQYLDLAPLKGSQFTKIEKVADRPAPEAAPVDAVTPTAAVTPPPEAQAAAKPAPLVPVPAPAAVATAPAQPKPPAAQAANLPATPKPPQKTAAQAPAKPVLQTLAKPVVQTPAKPAAPVIRIRTAAKPAPAPKHQVTAAHTPNSFNLQLPRSENPDDVPAESATAPAYGYPVPSQSPEQHRDFNDLVHSLGVQ